MVSLRMIRLERAVTDWIRPERWDRPLPDAGTARLPAVSDTARNAGADSDGLRRRKRSLVLATSEVRTMTMSGIADAASKIDDTMLIQSSARALLERTRDRCRAGSRCNRSRTAPTTTTRCPWRSPESAVPLVELPASASSVSVTTSAGMTSSRAG